MWAWVVKWFLGGGWLWAIGAAGLFAGYLYLSNLQATAARVPVLLEAIKGKDALIGAMKKADADRDRADKELSQWQGVKDDVLAAIRKGMLHAPIHTDPRCFPTADDRRMWNDAFDKLLPTPAVPAH